MDRRIIGILTIGLLGVSFGAPLARFVPELSALTIAFWRMALASLLLWGFSGIKQQGSLPREKYASVGVAGIFLALHFACFYTAVKMVPIANATLFATLAPIFTLVYERFSLHRKLPFWAMVGLWISISGVLIVQSSSLELGLNETLGNLIALASSVFMSVVLIIAERVRGDISNTLYTRWLYLFAAITLGVIALLSGAELGMQLVDLKWLLALAIIPTLIGHNSMSYAVKFLRPTIVGSMPFGEPVLATLLAFILFGEKIGLQLVIGGGVVLVGLMILTINRASKQGA